MGSSVTSLADLAREARTEADNLDRELSEIEVLEQQVRMEASRYETRRSQAQERLSIAESRGPAGVTESREAVQQLVATTRRASLMEAQMDVLEGKRRALTRYRDRLRAIAEATAEAEQASAEATALAPSPPSRAILTAQEDLRRDIARQMHDGPAQSLANIALQAQIVQRLVGRDPERAAAEVAQLTAMVEGALDATKAFIFDVRPMVLDDLGLVPTLRRVARERGRRHRLPIEFDSVGPDRRLPEDVESGLFRIVDDAIAGYAETSPARLLIRFDWNDGLVRARVSAIHADDPVEPAPPAAPAEDPARRSRLGRRRQSDEAQEVVPALAALIEAERVDQAAADDAARQAVARARSLPSHSWRQIEQRARTLGVEVSLADNGATLEAAVSAA